MSSVRTFISRKGVTGEVDIWQEVHTGIGTGNACASRTGAPWPYQYTLTHCYFLPDQYPLRFIYGGIFVPRPFFARGGENGLGTRLAFYGTLARSRGRAWERG